MKFCPNCGKQVSDSAMFCDKCGHKFNNQNLSQSANVTTQQSDTTVKTVILSLLIVILVVVIGIGAYIYISGSAKNQTTNKTQNTSKTYSSTSNTSSSNNDNSAVWNSSKDKMLQNFMASWGSDMHQNYDYFNPANQDNYMGYKFPDAFSKGTVRVNGSKVSIGWSDNGSGNNDYNVVAIFSDFDSDRGKGNTVSPHLYLFAIHDGQPVALVTQQNQGNSENAVYFKPTANSNVSTQFANIVNNNQMTY
ncbi:DUF4767 domain-containing protein [Fructilactobacillus sp. Tb1]|uniref:zinc ribbon domain-containing protein n=1 Tax=Fructilactobacillus sp. Tb1 TaxID=3422304 RepID=UPI003D2945CF